MRGPKQRSCQVSLRSRFPTIRGWFADVECLSRPWKVEGVGFRARDLVNDALGIEVGHRVPDDISQFFSRQRQHILPRGTKPRRTIG